MRQMDVRIGDLYICHEEPSEGDPGYRDEPTWCDEMAQFVGLEQRASEIDGVMIQLEDKNNRDNRWWWHVSWIEPVGAPPPATAPIVTKECCTSIWGCSSCRSWQKVN